MPTQREQRSRGPAFQARRVGPLLLLLCLLAACSAPRAGREAADGAPADARSVDQRAEALARYARGVSFDMRGEPKSALEEYQRAATFDPSNLRLVMDVSRRLIRNGDYTGAEQLLERASREKDAPANLHALLAAVYTQNGRTNEAVAASRRAVQLDPKQFGGHQTLFDLYLRQEKFKEALAVLDAAAKQKDVDAAFLLDLSDQYARYGVLVKESKEASRKKAVAVLERVEALNPTEEPVRFRLADGFKESGETARAEAIYLGLLEGTRNENAIRQRLLELYIRAGDEAKIEEQLKELSGRNPANPQIYFLLGGLYADQQKWPQAIESLKKARLLNPNLEPVYFTLADVYSRDKQHEEAVKVLGEARALFGGTFQIEFATALAHTVAKNYPEALKSITAAEKIATTTETNRLTEGFYFQLGAVHERNKKFDTSEKYFRKALELKPDFAEALNYLGYMWAERGEKLDEAFQMIQRAVKQEPENAAFLDSLAWVLHQQGKHREALPWIEKALKFLDEPDATIHDHLGDILWKLGRKDKAREAWKKSLEIEDNPAMRRKLDTPGSDT
jgi:tetratricopeptide (TPR) repeat protein